MTELSNKAHELIQELIAASVAFGGQIEPNWQTRIDKAQRELREYIDELERDCDMLFRSAANKQTRKNTVSQTFVYGKESEE